MCGIVGYIGNRCATTVVLDGLRQLEYRGYDSAGLAVVDHNGVLQTRRAAGKLGELLKTVEEQPVEGRLGMGHARGRRMVRLVSATRTHSAAPMAWWRSFKTASWRTTWI